MLSKELELGDVAFHVVKNNSAFKQPSYFIFEAEVTAKNQKKIINGVQTSYVARTRKSDLSSNTTSFEQSDEMVFDTEQKALTELKKIKNYADIYFLDPTLEDNPVREEL